jgi:hypothetical protein
MAVRQSDNRQRDSVKAALVDIPALVAGLGLSAGSKRCKGGITVLCPHHAERHASCNVTEGEDGTPRVRCWSCGWTGDALDLICEVRGYIKTDGNQFREVLAEGAEIAGMFALVDEIRDGREPDPNRPAPEKPQPKPAPEYPPVLEVLDVWETSFAVTEDNPASAYLRGRAISPEDCAKRDLLRVIGFGTARPAWSYAKGLPWVNTGHRLAMRAWAADGTFRSLRVWQCDGRDGYPKRLPPTGHRAQGLVLANDRAVEMLRGESKAERVVIVEGEPDHVTVSTRCPPGDAVFGVGSGFWSEEHAKRIPNRTPVLLMTHADDAGDNYAKAIAKTLNNRCPIWRFAL